MKINHPATWGVVLALLSPASAQVLVGGSMEAPGDFCDTSADCPVGFDGFGQYCASDGFCTPMGGCATVEDCNSRENTGYAMVTCVGTKTCENRMCGIVCDGNSDFPPIATCSTNADCLDGEFCASDGVCERLGGCATVSDCFLEENQGYPIAACIGSLGCVGRTCQMKCTSSDALIRCETNEECELAGMYCGGYGHCVEHGACGQDADCDNEKNIFDEIYCVGTRYCDDDGMCAKTCGEGCSEAFDCPGETYCSGNNVCLDYGTCEVVEDCQALDHLFVYNNCIGTITCDNGQCGKVCDAEPLPDLCVTNDDCVQDDSYCAGNGICTKSGYCDREADCTKVGNDVMLPACVGTVTCDNGQCGKICDTTEIDPVSAEKDNAAPVDVNLVTCFTDDDCNSITSATARSATGKMFCAQGVCTEQGSCQTDEDCMNPANFLWNDKRCMGYLHCTSDRVCDRECGVMCKNGSKSADCFEDECAKINWTECVGAVGCFMDTCDDTCSAVLYDAAGKVMDGCVMPDMMDMNKAMPDDPSLTSPDDPNTNEIMRLGSSAARATSVIAILAALSAAIIV